MFEGVFGLTGIDPVFAGDDAAQNDKGAWRQNGEYTQQAAPRLTGTLKPYNTFIVPIIMRIQIHAPPADPPHGQ
ncbi:MAG: hypothetical protein ACKN9C_06005, partial [Fluviibacter sp.]